MPVLYRGSAVPKVKRHVDLVVNVLNMSRH